MVCTVEQNTQEWLDLRKKYVGASDAPIIMKASPWKTPYQLWQEKLGLVPNDTETLPMRQGKLMEEPARLAYMKYTGNLVTPQVVFHPTKSFMMASLDGLSLNGDIAVEIKNAGEIDHSLAEKGMVPEKYFPQLQHQLACLNFKVLHYYSFREGKGVLIEVERDDGYLERLYKEEESFWNNVLNFSEPELVQADYSAFEDEDLAAKWIEVNEKMDNLKKLEREYRDALIAKAAGKNARGCGIRLTKVVRKGNIDYNAIPELQQVDLEQYRKDVIQSWRITKSKD